MTKKEKTTLVIVILLVVAIAVYFFFGKDKDKIQTSMPVLSKTPDNAPVLANSTSQTLIRQDSPIPDGDGQLLTLHN